MHPPCKAPDFSLPNEEGKITTLSDFRGSWLVLYFYPADDTPGCTIEACGMRDARDSIIDLEANVVGVSKDSTISHDAFKAKYMLNFTLLSDEKLETIKDYGCWGKKMFGVQGVLRKTFIIDPDGIVQKIYGRVTPIGHAEKVIHDLKELIKDAV